MSSNVSETSLHFYRGLEKLFQLTAGSLDRSRQLTEIGAWSSLGAVEFIAFADEEYGVVVKGDQIRSCRTVGDLEDLVRPTRSADVHGR